MKLQFQLLDYHRFLSIWLVVFGLCNLHCKSLQPASTSEAAGTANTRTNCLSNDGSNYSVHNYKECSKDVTCRINVEEYSKGNSAQVVQCIDINVGHGGRKSQVMTQEQIIKITGPYKEVKITCSAQMPLDFEYDGTTPTEAIKIHHFKEIPSLNHSEICYEIEIKVYSAKYLDEKRFKKNLVPTDLDLEDRRMKINVGSKTGRYLVHDLKDKSRYKSYYLFFEEDGDGQADFIRNVNTLSVSKSVDLTTIPCRPTYFDAMVAIFINNKENNSHKELLVDNKTVNYQSTEGFTIDSLILELSGAEIVGCSLIINILGEGGEDSKNATAELTLRFNLTSGQQISKNGEESSHLEALLLAGAGDDRIYIHSQTAIGLDKQFQTSIKCRTDNIHHSFLSAIQFNNPSEAKLTAELIYKANANQSCKVQIGTKSKLLSELTIDYIKQPGVGLTFCNEMVKNISYFKFLGFILDLDQRIWFFNYAKVSQELDRFFASPAENLIQISPAAAKEVDQDGGGQNSTAVYYISQKYTFRCKIFAYLLVPPVIWYQRFVNGTENLAFADNFSPVEEGFADGPAGVRISEFNLIITNDTKEIIASASIWNDNVWKNVTYIIPTVEDGEAPKISTESSIVTFPNGGLNRTIKCKASGRPVPILTWEKDGKILVSNKSTMVTLLLSQVSSIHAGDYICKASNIFGSTFKPFIIETYQEENIVKFLGGLGIPAILFIIATISLYVYLRFLRKQPIGLTEKEIEAFEDGDPEFVKEIEAMVPQAAWRMPYTRELEIPARDFEILNSDVLGSGHYGIVYKAKVKEIIVAAKTLKSNADKTCLKGLLSELKIMSYIGEHENIVKLVGSNTRKLREGQVYIFVELCEFGSLEDYLRKNRQHFVSREGSMYDNVQSNKLTEQQLYIWSYQIANAMSYLALKNVIHGDLATRNVLLSKDFYVKLTDFGLSRQIYRYGKYVKQTNDPLPWRWMSIEALRDLIFSTQSDVWSFGITLWEIFTLAEVPYPGLEWDLSFIQNLEKGLRMLKPKYCTQNFYEEVILQCWHTEPESRPTFLFLTQFISNLT